MHKHPKLIAIVGGSGAGKTWLARQLQSKLGPAASQLALDDFYFDRASVQPGLRGKVNYDHPRAIDWRFFEAVLRRCRVGSTSQISRYNFATHTRPAETEKFSPGKVVLVEGLWLLLRSRVRELFDFSVYLEAPIGLRLERRLMRDAAERGRELQDVRVQYWRTVSPMHERFVAPQAPLADITLSATPDLADVENLAETIRALVSEGEDRMTDGTEFSAERPITANSVNKPNVVSLAGNGSRHRYEIPEPGTRYARS